MFCSWPTIHRPYAKYLFETRTGVPTAAVVCISMYLTGDVFVFSACSWAWYQPPLDPFSPGCFTSFSPELLEKGVQFSWTDFQRCRSQDPSSDWSWSNPCHQISTREFLQGWASEHCSKSDRLFLFNSNKAEWCGNTSLVEIDSKCSIYRSVLRHELTINLQGRIF